jgi:hypothetical protein
MFEKDKLIMESTGMIFFRQIKIRVLTLSSAKKEKT